MNIVIFGAGGLGGMVLDTLLQTSTVRVIGFLDSDPSLTGAAVGGVSVLGGLDAVPFLIAKGVTNAVVAIGTNADRVRVAGELESRGMMLASAIHPLARIAPTAQIGKHLIAGPRVSVCVHSKIGDHVVLSAGAIIDHDNVIGDGVFIHPAVRLAGGVKVESLATIGIGASVIPGKRIGTAARVEPGAVVIRDIPPHAIVQGVPADEISKRGTFVPAFPNA